MNKVETCLGEIYTKEEPNKLKIFVGDSLINIIEYHAVSNSIRTSSYDEFNIEGPTVITNIKGYKEKEIRQMPEDLLKQVEISVTDENLNKLGFTCIGMLKDFASYRSYNERLWLWFKIEGDSIYTIASYDMSNGYSKVKYTDLHVPEILGRYFQ